MKYWIEATRPKTLIASISPVLIGSVIAFDLKLFHFAIFIASLLFALAIQIGTNWANDYIDFLKGADTKDRKGPRRLVQAGIISAEKMRRATFGIFFVAALLGVYLATIGGWQIALLALLAILLGYFYTGGPYPLGYVGLGDIFVLIFFGPVATAGVCYLQTGEIVPTAILAGFAPGLLSTAILTMNNLRDHEQDQKAGKRTLPVRFGMSFGKWECATCLFLAALTPLLLVLLTKRHLFSVASLAIVPMGLGLIKQVFLTDKGETLAPLFPKMGKILTLYTLLFTLGWLF